MIPVCISSPDQPKLPPPPPAPPPAPEPTAKMAETPAATRATQDLAGKLGTSSLVIPFQRVNVPY